MCCDSDLPWNRFGVGSVNQTVHKLQPSRQVSENCVAIRGSKRLAADQGEPRWYDDHCDSEKPFVCQAFGVSTPFFLTVSTELRLAGGYIVGAGTIVSSTSAQVGESAN